MAAKIRLSRVGGKGKPFYRVIIIDESEKRDGKPIEVIGHYDPRKEPSIFEVNIEKAKEWVGKGATPTGVIRKYFGKIGVLPPVNFDKKKKKAPKGETQATAESTEPKPADAAPSETAQAPAAA